MALLDRLRNVPPEGPLSDQRLDMLEAAEEIERLRSAVETAINFLRSAPMESGYCCCGEPMDSHGYDSGHSPVDELAYHAGLIEEQLQSALHIAN